MTLTKLQEQGLKIAIERYKQGEKYTVISGYAGSGKSTLIKFIISALDISPEQVAYCAFTGKAAQVLRSKGCSNAMTAHKLLYNFRPMKDGSILKFPKPFPEVEKYKIIVVDEVSLLPKEMWNLLLSYHVYVIACGDPAQLPALTEGCTVLEKPHIFLSEIMRQAQESEIIRLTMDIRAGKKIIPFMGKEINIVRKRDYDDSMLEWADQVICATNRTRMMYNTRFREMLFGEVPSEPQIGEKLICLRNNWDVISSKEDAMVNGLTGILLSLTKRPSYVLGQEAKIILQTDYDEESVFNDILMDWKLITEGEPTLNKKTYAIFKDRPKPNELDYGYTITGWKAQGSEWDKVLAIEEGFPWETIEHGRFLYTVCTRARKKLTLVLKN